MRLPPVRLRTLWTIVVYGGDEPRRMGGGIELLPWSAVARGVIELPL